MFAKLSLLAFSLPLVSAMTFNTPTDVVRGRSVTFTWTSDAGDPPNFTLYVRNPPGDETYLQDVPDTTQNKITVVVPTQLGLDPGNGYFLEAKTDLFGGLQTFAWSDPFPVSDS